MCRSKLGGVCVTFSYRQHSRHGLWSGGAGAAHTSCPPLRERHKNVLRSAVCYREERGWLGGNAQSLPLARRRSRRRRRRRICHGCATHRCPLPLSPGLRVRIASQPPPPVALSANARGTIFIYTTWKRIDGNEVIAPPCDTAPSRQSRRFFLVSPPLLLLQRCDTHHTNFPDTTNACVCARPGAPTAHRTPTELRTKAEEEM